MYLRVDLNIIDTSTDSCKYVTFESDGKNGEGTSWVSDDLIKSTGRSEDEDGYLPPELLFEASLVDAIGGIDTLIRGTVAGAMLGEMAKGGCVHFKPQKPYDYLMNPNEALSPNTLKEDYVQ